MNITLERKKLILTISLLVLCAIGMTLRVLNINKNVFIYYDEGLYLDLNDKFLRLLEQNPPQSLIQLFQALKISMYLCLATGKALWIFISDLRVYFGGANAYYFPRVVASVFGCLTIPLVYIFARKYYKSHWIALISSVILAILPSHLYYSRLALQEAMCTFCFLAGFYFYFFSQNRWKQIILSNVFFVGAFFTNYRMFIIPFLVLGAEVVDALARKGKLDIRRYLWFTLIFYFIILGLIGNLYQGRNTVTVFSWVFYQAKLGTNSFNLLNFFSYPYYTFILESFVFGVLFWANIYLILRKRFNVILPFVLCCIQFGIFSMVQDQAPRYVCVVMPFMAMAVGNVIYSLWNAKSTKSMRVALVLILLGGVVFHLVRSVQIAFNKNDYQASIEFVESLPIKGKVLSTQNYIQKIYGSKELEIIPAPMRFRFLMALYTQGYRYLIIDPQSYVSYTASGIHFDPELVPYLESIKENVKPIKVFPHYQGEFLLRFVLEHDEDLQYSLKFLENSKQKNLGSLKVYDIQECIKILVQTVPRFENTIKYIQRNL